MHSAYLIALNMHLLQIQICCRAKYTAGSLELRRSLLLNLGKSKVIPVLFLNWAPRHEGVLGEWSGVTSALDGGK
jgi:hypothetical protein